MKQDSAMNEYVKQNEVFADILNMVLYQGKKVICKQDLKEADTTYGDRRRDVLKACVMKEDRKKRYVLIGIENQTRMDPIMPVRIMEYDAREYRRQIEIEQRKQKKEELEGGEFLSGVKKEIRLKPMITIVLLGSGERWEGARSLREMVEEMGEEESKLFQDYRINLLEPREVKEEELVNCESGVGKVLQVLKYSRKKEEMIEYLKREENQEVDEGTARVIEAITKIPMRVKEEGGINMCKATEEYTKECKEIGKAEGEKIGTEKEKINTAKRMIADGMKDEIISRYVELSVNAIQQLRKQELSEA